MRTTRLAVVLSALAVTLALGGAPAMAEPPATLDLVYTALGVDRIPADYVVMVDVSSSMQQQGRYAGVKNSLRAFFAALAPDDQVTLGAFADTVQIVYQGAAGRSPDKLVDTLPAAATGAHTDIGAAIEATVTRLRRTGAPGVATVVLLSDGQHDPPTGSAYPFESGYAWDELARTVQGLKKNSLQAYAVPLAGATGAPLLGKVFPDTRVLDPSSIDDLTNRLQLPKAAARAAKARSVLGDDPARPVQVTWPAAARSLGSGRTVVPVRLTSTSRYVPLTVSGLAVDTGDRALRASIPATPVTLTPGGSATVDVALDWDAGPVRAAPLSTVDSSATLTLSGTVGSTWSGVLADHLSTPLTAKLVDTRVDSRLSAQRGSYPLWVLGAVALGLVLLGLVRVRRRRLQPSLTGTLQVVLADGAVRRMSLRGHSAALTQSTLGLPGYGEVRMSRSSVAASETRLAITYSRDGATPNRETQLCGPRETVTVSGFAFTWQPDVPAPRRPRSASDPAAAPGRR